MCNKHTKKFNVWVMSSFYNMPEDKTLLVVENVVFPQADFTYFNLTILNPSNSLSDVNVTAFKLSIDGKNESYMIRTAEPSLLSGFLIRKGTRQSFKCAENWGSFAGESVRVEPVAENASTAMKSNPYVTPSARLVLRPDFDDFETVGYFNLTVRSDKSAMNHTISQITMLGDALNVTPSLPYTLQPNETRIFKCDRNWEDLRGQNVTIALKTAEGFESSCEARTLRGAVLFVEEPKFDYSDTTYFNVTIRSSQDSTANARLSGINLTISNETSIALDTIPPLNIIPIPIPPNQSLIFKCLWDWSSHRNTTITVSLHTKQSFTIENKTVKTPKAVVWEITGVNFDLDDIEHFSVNVTNSVCSTHDLNVTMIQLNNQTAVLDSPFVIVSNGTQAIINCTIDWTNLVGQTVNITVFTEDGAASRILTIPHFALKLNKPSVGEALAPYVNITISNSANSIRNATITKIVFEILNETYEIDPTLTYPRLAPNGYTLRIGEDVTIVCPSNWSLYTGENLKVIVYTLEGIRLSETWLLSEFVP